MAPQTRSKTGKLSAKAAKAKSSKTKSSKKSVSKKSRRDRKKDQRVKPRGLNAKKLEVSFDEELTEYSDDEELSSLEDDEFQSPSPRKAPRGSRHYTGKARLGKNDEYKRTGSLTKSSPALPSMTQPTHINQTEPSFGQIGPGPATVYMNRKAREPSSPRYDVERKAKDFAVVLGDLQTGLKESPHQVFGLLANHLDDARVILDDMVKYPGSWPPGSQCSDLEWRMHVLRAYKHFQTDMVENGLWIDITSRDFPLKMEFGWRYDPKKEYRQEEFALACKDAQDNDEPIASVLKEFRKRGKAELYARQTKESEYPLPVLPDSPQETETPTEKRSRGPLIHALIREECGF